ncbi:hypothetical protein KIPB_005431, partial [Kipferlia bialata]|eukprot:g5431.t1
MSGVLPRVVGLSQYHASDMPDRDMSKAAHFFDVVTGAVVYASGMDAVLRIPVTGSTVLRHTGASDDTSAANPPVVLRLHDTT